MHPSVLTATAGSGAPLALGPSAPPLPGLRARLPAPGGGLLAVGGWRLHQAVGCQTTQSSGSRLVAPQPRGDVAAAAAAAWGPAALVGCGPPHSFAGQLPLSTPLPLSGSGSGSEWVPSFDNMRPAAALPLHRSVRRTVVALCATTAASSSNAASAPLRRRSAKESVAGDYADPRQPRAAEAAPSTAVPEPAGGPAAVAAKPDRPRAPRRGSSANGAVVSGAGRGAAGGAEQPARAAPGPQPQQGADLGPRKLAPQWRPRAGGAGGAAGGRGAGPQRDRPEGANPAAAAAAGRGAAAAAAAAPRPPQPRAPPAAPAAPAAPAVPARPRLQAQVSTNPWKTTIRDRMDFENECPDIGRMEQLVARSAHTWHPVVICAGLNRVVQVGPGGGTEGQAHGSCARAALERLQPCGDTVARVAGSGVRYGGADGGRGLHSATARSAPFAGAG